MDLSKKECAECDTDTIEKDQEMRTALASDQPLLENETKKETDVQTERRSLAASICALALSIPALIGACCWPALVIGMITGSTAAAGSASRELSHWLSFVFTFLLMVVMIVLHVRSLKNRSYMSTCSRNGPLILTVIAAILILADPTRHVLQETEIWPATIDGKRYPGSSAMYREDCTIGNDEDSVSRETILCLSTIGWIFYLATFLGFIFLFIAVLWNANILEKCRLIRQQWNALREEEEPVLHHHHHSDSPYKAISDDPNVSV